MTYTVLVTAEAEADLAAARSWYAENAPEQVARLVNEVDVAIRRVSRFPETFPPVCREARRVSVKVFPYQLWFRIHAAEEVIEVLALVHVRQDRGTFIERLE